MRRCALLTTTSFTIALLYGGLLTPIENARASDCPYWTDSETGKRYKQPPPGRMGKMFVMTPCPAPPTSPTPSGAGGMGHASGSH